MLKLESVDPRADGRLVEQLWRSLVAPTYFLSWGWIDTWLSTLPAHAVPTLWVARDERGPVGAFFLGSAWRKRAGVPFSRTRHLNATGDDDLDTICLEHNGAVVRDGATLSWPETLRALPGPWDEVWLAALDDGVASFEGTPYRVVVRLTRSCQYVDLAAVRAKGDYVALLGGETRSQLRRARRLYEGLGPLTVEHAEDLPTAHSMLDELRRLHEASWQKKGEAGAFSKPYFNEFHRALLDRRFGTGEVQLLRVRAGDTTIGCLYNFVHEGVLSYYQSGLVAPVDNKWKPGLVAHAEAVRWNAERGHLRYDFLAGNGQYKRQLATDATEMTWIRVERPRVRFLVERAARGVVARLRSMRSVARPAS